MNIKLKEYRPGYAQILFTVEYSPEEYVTTFRAEMATHNLVARHIDGHLFGTRLAASVSNPMRYEMSVEGEYQIVANFECDQDAAKAAQAIEQAASESQ